ncbi:MAG: glucose-6-phosphate dehydrogenase, partial [Chloroflexi bacterium]|nr:glucose-6-phosphate dehydrogenase [Chloroflexota bacterium]
MAELIPVDTFDFVIFGGSGDLALRKLLPALFHRDLDGQFPAGSRIIALGRSPMEHEEYLELAKSSLGNPEQWEGFASRLSYLRLDATRPSEWQALVDLLGGHEDRIRAVYLATSPELFGPVATGLRDNGLITEKTRIVLEKPVGHDYPSALAINDQVGACFHENQIFRIDHYLGKETVQNLLAL